VDAVAGWVAQVLAPKLLTEDMGITDTEDEVE
jgi:hypothetical protein